MQSILEPVALSLLFQRLCIAEMAPQCKLQNNTKASTATLIERDVNQQLLICIRFKVKALIIPVAPSKEHH